MLFAHVAVLRLDGLPELGIAIHLALLEAGRWEDVRAGEHRLPAQRPNSGPLEHPVFPLDLFRLLPPDGGPQQMSARGGIRSVDVPGCLQQATLVVPRHLREESPVGNDRFEQLDRGTEPVEKRGIRVLDRESEVCCWHGPKSNYS